MLVGLLDISDEESYAFDGDLDLGWGREDDLEDSEDAADEVK